MRKRHQSGSVHKALSGKRRVWAGLYYDVDGKRKYVVLGNRREITESQARIELEKILSPVNQARAAQQVTREITVAGFVSQVYLKHGERKWKASTGTTTRQRISQHVLNGELANTRMVDLNRESLQAFLDRRGIGSFSVVNHLRWDLKRSVTWLFPMAFRIETKRSNCSHHELLFSPSSPS